MPDHICQEFAMKGNRHYLFELRSTLILAAPITAGHLSQMIMGFVDTIMIGRVGVVPLAASAFANTLVHLVFIVGIGLLTSVAIMVSHAHGRKDPVESAELLRRGLIISLISGLGMLLLIGISLPFLHFLGQPYEVIEACKGYLLLVGGSLPFLMIIVCFKNFSEAQDTPWPAFWSGLAAVFLNIFLNWVLIYGNLGAPALGLEGAGLATLLARIFNLFFLIAWLRLHRSLKDSWPAHWLAPVSWLGIRSMILFGIPVGLQLLMEVGAFGATTLLMGWLGIIQLAAHQIAITCAATTFMVPLGISLAVGIRVGHAMGVGQVNRARVIGFGAFAFGALMSGLFAATFIFFNRPLAALFTQDPATVLLASQLLIVAGLFQFFDGEQVLAVGALRGCKDVRKPTWIIFIAYWILALPFGSLLAFGFSYGALGLWIGLALGLGLAAVGLVARFVWRTGSSAA